MAEYYETSQICLNGHTINCMASENSRFNCDYCTDCGEMTITTCPNCKTNIRGQDTGLSLIGIEYTTPAYCHQCGNPYPWTEKKIQTAIQMFAEFGDLEDEEKKTIEEDICNIAKEIPQAELSAMRVKRIWQRCGNVAYSAIMEFASKTAAEILKS